MCLLYTLQHFDSVHYFDSINNYRKFIFSKIKKVNLFLAKKFLNFPANTSLHNTDFRCVRSYYQNIWIKGLIRSHIFIFHDYGNDKFFTSSRTRVFKKNFAPFLGITKQHLYFIGNDEYFNYVIKLGNHNLTLKQYNFFIKFYNDKRPFSSCIKKRKNLVIELRWRNFEAIGNYEMSFDLRINKKRQAIL